MILTLLSLFVAWAQADWLGSPSLEGAFGITNNEITNPDSSKAVYEGYTGFVQAGYSFFDSERFELTPHVKFFYSEMDNKANTTALTEDLRVYGYAPGLELRVYSVFGGLNYRYQRLAVEMSGSVNSKITSRFGSAEFYLGVEIPVGAWGFRLTYLRSESELPTADTSLSRPSPWSDETVLLSIRYNFGPRFQRNPYDSYSPSSLDSSDSGTTDYPARRTIRYTPRPSTRLDY